MAETAAPALDPKNWKTGPNDTVLVSDVVRTAGVPHAAIDYTIRLGLVPVLSQARERARRYISREDAVMLVVAAGLAMAAGVAVAAIVRAIRATQATVTPAGLMIPMVGGA